MEMKTYKIGDLYAVSNGLSKGKAFFGQGYPFLTFSEVMNNFFVPDILHSLVQTEDKERAKFSIQRGDVFLNRTSETADELGISCVALKDYPDATFNGFCKRLRPISEDVVPEYIGYYLRTNAFRRHMSALTGSMITRASLRNEQLLSIEIDLPSKENQLKIAHILRQYDILIDNCKKQIALLEEAAQRLYREWFVDLRFPGHETTLIGENGLPEGWRKEAIFPFCQTVLGGTPSRKNPDFWNGNTPWINSGAVNLDRITVGTEYITDIALKKSATKLMPKHTTLLAITGATLGQVSYTEIEVCGNQSIIGIIPPNPNFEEYIYLLITDEIETIISPAGGSAQQHINKDILNKYEITIPSDDVLIQFKDRINPYFDKITTCYQTLNHCKELNLMMLPRLISGQIEINA